MPKIVDHNEVRGHIRRTARAVFADRGVKGTGLEHVASAAGVGRSTLYHYYPSKEVLLSELTEELLQVEEQAFHDASAASGSPSKRMLDLVDRLLDSFSDWSSIDLIMLDLRGSQGAHFRTFYRTIRTRLSELIREGQVVGEFNTALNADPAAACIVGLIDGLLLQFIADRPSFARMRGWREATKRSVMRILDL
jgi:AcrR family transcriptional regulator